MKEKIVVGMSGGVDSSVAAYLLHQQGYDCIGVFMRNWDEQDEDGVCTATDDYDDVRRVCDHIGIPYYTVNFTREYYDRVFKHFLEEYKAGRTPNPDILCNREIKFNTFLDFAQSIGATQLATGHYANLRQQGGKTELLRAKDSNKDQTYFLCDLNQKQLSKAMFPIGQMLKSEVREVAQKAGLPTFAKKDSTGICFIGERNFREFLQKFIPAQKGEMRTLSGKYMGQHQGVMYYTLGQRHGLGIGGTDKDGRPWFVVGKDVQNNILYVEQGEHEALYSNNSYTESFNWILGQPPAKEFDCTAKFRYRQTDQEVHVKVRDDGGIELTHYQPQRAVTPGQSVVLYINEVCLGGGVIAGCGK